MFLCDAQSDAVIFQLLRQNFDLPSWISELFAVIPTARLFLFFVGRYIFVQMAQPQANEESSRMVRYFQRPSWPSRKTRCFSTTGCQTTIGHPCKIAKKVKNKKKAKISNSDNDDDHGENVQEVVHYDLDAVDQKDDYNLDVQFSEWNEGAVAKEVKKKGTKTQEEH